MTKVVMGRSAGGKIAAIQIGTIEVKFMSEIQIPVLISDLVVS